MAVIGQECLDTSVRDQLSTEGCGVEQLRVGFAVSLHPPILDDPDSNREHRSDELFNSLLVREWSPSQQEVQADQGEERTQGTSACHCSIS